MHHYLQLFYALPFGAQLVIVLGSMLVLAIILADFAERLRKRRDVDARIDLGLEALRRDAEFRARTDRMIFPKPELRPDESAMRGQTGPRRRP